jgi:hypothetical protein
MIFVGREMMRQRKMPRRERERVRLRERKKEDVER